MTVSWKYEDNSIYFEMTAPTEGWIAIGFNPDAGITGTYLLMGRVVNGKAEVVEHYTVSPGNYKAINILGDAIAVQDVSGEENSNSTTIRFSLPMETDGKYQRNMIADTPYQMLLAYSRDDDFQHHSMMRTSVSIKL